MAEEPKADKNSHRHLRYCQQWNQPPVRYKGEYGELTFTSQCGFPTTWVVGLPADYSHNYTTRNTDYSCDVHLSQAVRRLMESGFHALEVTVYRDEETS